MANAMRQYHCSTCTAGFDESTVEAVLKRAAANTHGEAISPEFEAATRIMRIRDEAMASLVYACSTCRAASTRRPCKLYSSALPQTPMARRSPRRSSPPSLSPPGRTAGDMPVGRLLGRPAGLPTRSQTFG